jgi:hypothetical protein
VAEQAMAALQHDIGPAQKPAANELGDRHWKTGRSGIHS